MFRGSIVALVTPMHDDGAVDWNALAALIEWHCTSGTDAIVSVGTTGESATLNPAEHKAVIRFTVEKSPAPAGDCRYGRQRHQRGD